MIALGTLKHDLAEYEERLNIEIATIKEMGFPGYFLIVWDFIKYAREQGIPVGPGPRFGGRFARGVLSADHRCRSAAVRSAVRAFSQSGTHLDARYRHRFLHSRPRQRDRSCDRVLRPRIGLPDHYLWNDGVAGGDQGCRPGAWNMPYGDVEKIAKMIPPPIRGRNVSISQALETVPEMKAAMKDAKVKELVDLAFKARGLFAAYVGPRGRRRYLAETAARACSGGDVGQGRTYEPVSDERSRKGRDAQDGFSRADDADRHQRIAWRR